MHRDEVRKKTTFPSDSLKEEPMNCARKKERRIGDRSRKERGRPDCNEP